MKYDDIINLPHHVSETRARMSLSERAAQFSPFAALSGHNDAIEETARLTNQFAELDENVKSVINAKLLLLLENIDRHPEITVTFFKKDEKKPGGEYIILTDKLEMIDTRKRLLMLSGGDIVPIENIYDI